MATIEIQKGKNLYPTEEARPEQKPKLDERKKAKKKKKNPV